MSQLSTDGAVNLTSALRGVRRTRERARKPGARMLRVYGALQEMRNHRNSSSRFALTSAFSNVSNTSHVLSTLANQNLTAFVTMSGGGGDSGTYIDVGDLTKARIMCFSAEMEFTRAHLETAV
jgi:hypothetical protein